MSFLEPFVRQRETIGNLNNPNDIEEDEPETQENTAVTETQENTTVTESDGNTSEATRIPVTATEFTPTLKKQRFSSNIKQLSKLKKDEPASSQLMKYLIEKQQREETGRSAPKDPTDFFCESIAEKIKRFTPYYRNIAESRIFTLVQELELEQLLQTQVGHKNIPNSNILIRTIMLSQMTFLLISLHMCVRLRPLLLLQLPQLLHT